MVQWWRALVALWEDAGSIPTPTWLLTTTVAPVLGYPTPSLLVSVGTVCTWCVGIHAGKTSVHIMNKYNIQTTFPVHTITWTSWQSLPGLLSYLVSVSLPWSHTDFLSVPWTCQASSCLRAFVLAIHLQSVFLRRSHSVLPLISYPPHTHHG